jgi:diguanylate cyclase (GGDEF)-like protein/PAS domain S-box-containing protein
VRKRSCVGLKNNAAAMMDELKVLLQQLKDYEALKYRCEHVEEARARLEAAVAALDEGVIGVALDGTITEWNPAAEQMYGYPKKEILGRPLGLLVSPRHRDEMSAALAEIAEGKRIEHHKILGMRKDGRPIKVCLHLTPVKDAKGAIFGVASIVRDITERSRTKEVLQSTNERLNETLDYAADAYFALDDEWRFLEVNRGAEKIFNRHAEELVGTVFWQECGGTFDAELCRKYRTAASERRAIRTEAYIPPLERWFEILVCPRRNRLESYFHDITTYKRAEETEHKGEEQARTRLAELRAIYATVPLGLCFVDTELRYVSVNEQFASMNGLPVESHVGRTVGGAVPVVADWTEEYLRHVVKTGEPVEGLQISGRTLALPAVERDWLAYFSPARDEEGRLLGINIALLDITERKRAEEAMRFHALHDALTGLPNRMLFMDRLALELAEGRRNRKMLAVVFLDLDNFKNINDTHGHSTGDKLLMEVAGRLKTCIRETDTVARIGGDEFNMVLPDIGTAESAVPIANKIISLFEDPFVIEKKELPVTASIGITISPADGENAEVLLKNADIAMYQAKGQGGNKYQFYSSAMNLKTFEIMLIENNLRKMVEHRELVLHYQPQFIIATRQVCCAEALVRWQHPELGLLGPAQFLPLADETGVITSIDEWVLRTACAQARAWHEAGHRPLPVTVNLSARQCRQRNLTKIISRILNETGLDPDLLEVEIAESTLMSNIEPTLASLGGLIDIGIGISLDDFGSGFSCLSLLKRLPIRRLKIDRSFTSELKEDRARQAIVSATIEVAHKMNVGVVAEGVETEDQLTFLRSKGCDEMQGYLFSKPLPGDKFEQWLTSSMPPFIEDRKE